MTKIVDLIRIKRAQFGSYCPLLSEDWEQVEYDRSFDVVYA